MQLSRAAKFLQGIFIKSSIMLIVVQQIMNIEPVATQILLRPIQQSRHIKVCSGANLSIN